jgi:hypothetical protein
MDKKTKKFLGIMFECCHVYSRIYINKDGTAYEGKCPRCLKEIKVRIGKEGTSSRFFRAE